MAVLVHNVGGIEGTQTDQPLIQTLHPVVKNPLTLPVQSHASVLRFWVHVLAWTLKPFPPPIEQTQNGAALVVLGLASRVKIKQPQIAGMTILFTVFMMLFMDLSFGVCFYCGEFSCSKAKGEVERSQPRRK